MAFIRTHFGEKTQKDSVCLVCERKETKCAAFQSENDRNESLCRHCVFNEQVISKENHYRVFHCNKYHKIKSRESCPQKVVDGHFISCTTETFSESSVDKVPHTEVQTALSDGQETELRIK